MLWYKKLIILFIILIATYIIWRLIQKQIEIGKIQAAATAKMIPPTIEGLFTSSPESELATVQIENPLSIKPYSQPLGELPLREFIIKGSYNTAITGNYVNKDMVTYILKRGCRYLDFEIFLVDQKAVVSYCTDPSFNILLTDNTVSLNDILTTIVLNLTNAPNKSDPLFINMRIKSNDVSIYPIVAASVDYHLNSLLYKGIIANDMPLSTFNDKIVLIVDKTINPEYASLCDCANSSSNPCYDLRNYINLETGSETLLQQPYTQLLNQCWNTPIINNNNITTNITKMRITVPDSVTQYSTSPYIKQNPDFIPFIRQQGCQLIPLRFYLLDSSSPSLASYEDFFNKNKSAFVPLAIALRAIQ
jgi:hypothetical protein